MYFPTEVQNDITFKHLLHYQEAGTTFWSARTVTITWEEASDSSVMISHRDVVIGYVP
jgi:hypothetical protein